MIHYHGGPCTPNEVARELWTRRHAMVSFWRPDQIELAAELSQSFALDNGAYSAWTAGEPITDWGPYVEWVAHWGKHPGCDFALIPDDVTGDETANDHLIENYDLGSLGVPVWHLHESIERLLRLAGAWPRVALGSSGAFSDPGSAAWWDRLSAAMDALCDEEGRPPCRLHGLRMLDPTLFSHLPLASADSTAVARNIGIDSKWHRAPYAPRSKTVRATILADRIEHHASATVWNRATAGTQANLELIG